MNRPRIVVTAHIDGKHMRILEDLADVTVTGWTRTGSRLDEDSLITELRGAAGLIVEHEKVTRRVIESAGSLQIIGCCRGNPVNVDIAAASERRIPVVYAPGRNANAAAEFTIGLMIAEARHLARAHHSLRSGRYLGEPVDLCNPPDPGDDVVWTLDGDSPYKVFKGFELAGRTLGLVGLGSIGSRVAQLAGAFGMRVMAYDPYADPHVAELLRVELAPLERVMAESDFVSISCKVTPETVGLIGAREISLMKPTAILINTARALIVDQDALVDALRNRRIRGAALDVFWNEPLPSNHPLLDLDNVTLTPHLAGASFDVALHHSEMVVTDFSLWFRGLRPRNVMNPSVLSR